VILSADGDDINDAAALAQAWTTARAPVVRRADAPHSPNRLPASALDALSVQPDKSCRAASDFAKPGGKAAACKLLMKAVRS
jgi:hypothetical protein